MEDSKNETLDLSRRGLKKIEKAPADESKTIINLILDQNELQRLDNIDTYNRVENLSICNNFLMRMHGVSRLTNIRILSLNNNSILQIEGLKDLIYLKVLKLAGNNIKSIEHLNNNMHLEHLDLSNNQISFIADISYLKHLKILSLERNRIIDLRQCDRYLPPQLEHLGLAHNNIQDLNEICHLVHLNKLDSFTVQGNPCVAMAGKDKLGFDYRPFVLNWILSVKSIDGFVVSAMESLKAEWLYSQGKGRHFHAGQHQELCEYLASTCPLTADALETEDQRKLRLILSKAQQHQQQLKDQNHSPLRPKLQSPRVQSRIASRHMGRSPDRLTSSYHSAMSKTSSPSHQMSLSCTGDIAGVPQVMSQSFDSPGLYVSEKKDYVSEKKDQEKEKPAVSSYHSAMSKTSSPSHQMSLSCTGDIAGVPQVMSQSFDSPGLYVSEKKDYVSEKKDKEKEKPAEPSPPKPVNQSLEAASKMVPVPESLMSPDYQDPIYDIHRTIPKPANHSVNSISNTSSQSSNSSLHEDKPQRQIVQPNKNIRGSPKLTKSATSSPKLKSKVERKGSLKTESKEEKKINGVKETNDQIEQDKLEIIKLASNQRRQKKTSVESMAAVTIQKMWRGYRSRNLNKDTLRILHAIQAARARQHIQRLTCDMEATKAALESERKIQQLQMQAINALWKKVSTLQSTDTQKQRACELEDSTEAVRQLTETCARLQQQVAELQGCMQDVVRCMCGAARTQAATQTVLTCVTTPQEERNSWLKRPQSLPLTAASVPAADIPPPTEQISEKPNGMESIDIERTESVIEDEKAEEVSLENEQEQSIITD